MHSFSFAPVLSWFDNDVLIMPAALMHCSKENSCTLNYKKEHQPIEKKKKTFKKREYTFIYRQPFSNVAYSVDLQALFFCASSLIISVFFFFNLRSIATVSCVTGARKPTAKSPAMTRAA